MFSDSILNCPSTPIPHLINFLSVLCRNSILYSATIKNLYFHVNCSITPSFSSFTMSTTKLYALIAIILSPCSSATSVSHSSTPLLVLIPHLCCSSPAQKLYAQYRNLSPNVSLIPSNASSVSPVLHSQTSN